jgi:potassium-transporting ATPase KdpC subunit
MDAIHVSPAAAAYQVARVATVRKIPLERVRKLLAEQTEGRQFGPIGEPRVNVLELNLALDDLATGPVPTAPAAEPTSATTPK